MNALSPARHPWLAALRADPGDALQAAIAGTADLSPWGRAEPQDAIAAVLHGVPRADPAWAALDEGCRQALAELRDRLLRAASEPAFHLALIRSERLLAVIGRLQQGETVADLHRRYPWWLAGFESGVVPDGVDLRAAYLRLLALTQEIAPGAPARLMPLWLDLCAESGEAGRYPAEYLAIGLLGLRRMRLAPGQSAQEEAACHGLARWAARQRPTRETFLARWGEIEHAFPRAFDFWPPLVERVLAQAEGGMSTQGGFPAADWWREELELSLIHI